MNETYETHAKGIRILPGQWRPHYPWEQIAWVSPPWPSQDYIWLDFPEAIFTDRGLFFLSHVNPDFPTVFGELPKVPWQETKGGICFERLLPDGLRFGGSVVRKDETTVGLELFIDNGSKAPLKNIRLQTCAFLRGIQEFGPYTMDNKFVHVPGSGWMPFVKARELKREDGKYHLGWRGGPKGTDLPVIVTVSNEAERLVAMTWGEHTFSLIGNPPRPCMHADPFFPDIPAGQKATIHGQLIFFEGTVEEFGRRFFG